jgi:hypothetical protein
VYEKDYILRIIQQMGAFLRAMLLAAQEQRPDDIISTSREALTLLLGLPPEVVESLTPDGLLTVLSVGGSLESTRALLAGEVFLRRMEAAALWGLDETVSAECARATLLLEAVIAQGSPEDAEHAGALLAEVERGRPA